MLEIWRSYLVSGLRHKHSSDWASPVQVFKIDGSYPERDDDYQLLLPFTRHEYESLESRRILISATFMRNIILGRIDSPTLFAKINFRVLRLASRLTETFTAPTSRTNILLHSAKNYHDVFQNFILPITLYLQF